LNRELAQVQSDLEAMSGTYAHLMQRVETEILNVSIVAEHNQAFWRPAAVSLSAFGTNLSQGIAIAITSFAYLIPWGVALALSGWVARRLWRRRKSQRGSA